MLTIKLKYYFKNKVKMGVNSYGLSNQFFMVEIPSGEKNTNKWCSTQMRTEPQKKRAAYEE